jgi:AcrR family transcriptional regulator
MTKAEIIDAAFRAWGRDLYHTTSLSLIARELGVSKPALYRHFENKQALVEAMTVQFYNDFAAVIRPDYEKALNCTEKSESVFTLIRGITGYYARNVHIFIFSMTQLYDFKKDSYNITDNLQSRGIDLANFRQSISKKYLFEALAMRLISATLTFYMAGFHKEGKSLTNPPSPEAIERIIDVINTIIGKGLNYSNREIDSLDYDRLETRIAGTVNKIEDDPLLKAVAGAVAEAGPWEASLEQVARRSGLSKSSLYYHFKNKKDMLYQLFMTEWLRIIDFARQGIKLSAIPLEQLFLGIFSIAEYLRSKPDILVCLDWIRYRRLDFSPPGHEHKPPIEFLQLFDDIDITPLHNRENPFRGLLAGEAENAIISPWVLFLIVKTLMRRNLGQPAPAPGQPLGKVPNSDIRSLYRFITLGIGGFRI